MYIKKKSFWKKSDSLKLLNIYSSAYKPKQKLTSRNILGASISNVTYNSDVTVVKNVIKNIKCLFQRQPVVL